MRFIKSWVAFNNLSLDLKPTFTGSFFFACGLMSHKVQEPFLVLFSRRCFDAGPSTLRLVVWGLLASNEGAVCRGPSLVVSGSLFVGEFISLLFTSGLWSNCWNGGHPVKTTNRLDDGRVVFLGVVSVALVVFGKSHIFWYITSTLMIPKAMLLYIFPDGSYGWSLLYSMVLTRKSQPQKTRTSGAWNLTLMTYMGFRFRPREKTHLSQLGSLRLDKRFSCIALLWYDKIR